MRYICLFLLLLSGCGQQPAPTMPAHVDPLLVPYFAKFTQYIGVRTDNISAGFVSLTLPRVGQCSLYDDGSRIIQIDPIYWAKIGDDLKEQLVFHELGHCAMGLQHIKDVDANNCPVSIMFPSVFGDTPCYINNKYRYYQELELYK